MMIPGIIILGKAGSGKTSVANFVITSNYATSFHSYALADKVKEIQRDLFPYLAGKPRNVLQHIGMSMRDIDADVWIRWLDKQILAHGKLAVIEDCRILNEYDHYAAKGYISIRVTCDDDTRIERMRQRDGTVDMDALQHRTETELDDIACDYTVDNGGSIERLAEQVDAILDEVM